MRAERWFRLLNHLTLGLACLCLVSAELPYLPGVELLLVPVVVLVAVAWWVEGRWVLPVWGANLLGVLILLGGGSWAAWLVLDPESWVDQAPSWGAALVPPLGPVLLALLVVKLFRPRTPADFWLLQGMGLLQVSLACVLATGPEVGGLLTAYVAAGLGCLAAHYLAAARAAPGQPWAMAGTGRPARGFLAAFVLSWTVLVGGLALALFLLTPRLDLPDWEPWGRFTGRAGHRSQTGFHEDIDLLHTGRVEVNSEPAWTVHVADAAGRSRTDLSSEQRWRGAVVDEYLQGLWTAEYQLPRPQTGTRPQTDLPDFGPGQMFFTFTVTPRQAGGLFLADPVRFGLPERRLPALHLLPTERRRPLFAERAGTLQPRTHEKRQEYVYRQVVPPSGEPGRVHAAHLSGQYIEHLTRNPVVGLDAWTIGLLRRLAADPRYRLQGALPAPPADGSARGFLLDGDQWEPVARALADYLAHGGEYTYTLDLRRQDTDIDPVLDFLLNVKQGNCDRYASALTLMLRSVGIPARVVKGFRGAEHQGEGVYLVRQSFAHSWVEALVPGGGEDGFDWLTLDPTPEADAAPAPGGLARWWEAGRRGGEQLWRNLILDYNADEQADLMARLGPRGAPGWAVVRLAAIGLAAILLLSAFVWWRSRRGRLAPIRRPASPVPFYRRLLALLQRHAGLAPAPGQTPREFAVSAGEILKRWPAAAGLADLPGAIAEAMYRVRFGGQSLTEAEGQALEGRLDELALALR